jgi:hypothetical protein
MYPAIDVHRQFWRGMTGKGLGLFDAHSTFDHKIDISHSAPVEVELST